MKKLIVFLYILFCYHSAFAAEAVPIVGSTAYEAGHILTTDPTKTLYWITVSWINSQENKWLIIYDSTTIPNDGTLTAAKILYCAVVSTSLDAPIGNKSFDWTNHPLYKGGTGMVAIVSTNASGCTTKTADGNVNWITAGVN